MAESGKNEGKTHALNIRGVSDEEFRLLKRVSAEMLAKSWKDVIVELAKYWWEGHVDRGKK